MSKRREENQTRYPKEDREFTSIGFWLPIGRTAFFHSKHDQPLLKKASQLNVTLNFEIKNVLNSTYNAEAPLDTSIYRRLLTVASYYGYVYAIPYFPLFRLDYLDIVEDTDPNTLLLISSEYPLRREEPNSLSGDTINFHESVKRSTLVVSSDGFYQWFFYHDRQENYPDFVRFLKNHLYEMAGNLIIYKGTPENNFRNKIVSNAFKNQIGKEVLKTYIDSEGMLVHSQLNDIVEGINNSLLDPRLWFSTHNAPLERTAEHQKDLQRNIELEKQKFSLNAFIREIVTYTDCFRDTENSSELQVLFESIEDLTNSAKNRDVRENLKCLAMGIYHNDAVRRDLLRQFIRKTLINLQEIRVNLTTNRRELLPHIISFKHYQQQLIQLPSDNPFAKEFYGVNQDQLEGYIEILAGKFSLIQDLQREIKLNFDLLSENAKIDIQGFFSDWVGRVDSLNNSTIALQKALARLTEKNKQQDQARTRREQETQAEIARRQHRLGVSDSGNASSELPSFFNIIVIFISTISAFFTITYGISQPFTIQNWARIVVLPALILLFGFIILKFIGERISKRYQHNNRFFHEIDLSLEVPIDADGAATIFVKGFKDTIHTIPREQLVVPSGLIGPVVGRFVSKRDNKLGDKVEEYFKTHLPHFPTFQNIKQVSYRYNQGIHKVHYEFDIHWPEKKALSRFSRVFKNLLWRLPFLSNPNIMEHCEIVYEVLSHSPSSRIEHMLQEFSFFATYKKKLGPEEVILLKLKLVNNFILRWLPEQYRPLEPQILEGLLPLFSLTITVLSPKTTNEQDPPPNMAST